jgi:hypothetical protein
LINFSLKQNRCVRIALEKPIAISVAIKRKYNRIGNVREDRAEVN